MRFPGKKVVCDNKTVNIDHLFMVRTFKRTPLVSMSKTKRSGLQGYAYRKKSPYR